MEPTISAVMLPTMEHVHISMDEHTAEVRLGWLAGQEQPLPVWSGPLSDLGSALRRLAYRSAAGLAFAE